MVMDVHHFALLNPHTIVILYYNQLHADHVSLTALIVQLQQIAQYAWVELSSAALYLSAPMTAQILVYVRTAILIFLTHQLYHVLNVRMDMLQMLWKHLVILYVVMEFFLVLKDVMMVMF